MSKLSPRDAVKVYQVSRATLMTALSDGTISAIKTDKGHWRIDPSELARVYYPRASQAVVSRTIPDQKAAVDQDLAARLAKAEAELAAEREKVDLLQSHLNDVRRILPPPNSTPRRRWWPW